MKNRNIFSKNMSLAQSNKVEGETWLYFKPEKFNTVAIFESGILHFGCSNWGTYVSSMIINLVKNVLKNCLVQQKLLKFIRRHYFLTKHHKRINRTESGNIYLVYLIHETNSSEWYVYMFCSICVYILGSRISVLCI